MTHITQTNTNPDNTPTKKVTFITDAASKFNV